MKKKFFRRMASVGAAAAIAAGACTMFAGCSSDHPEVTITYSFNGTDYAVDFVLSRNDAPNTVQHFLELADAGFYDGLVVHDIADDYTYHTGGYRIENGELVEVDYLSTVKALEAEQEIAFTQSVWSDPEATQGTYTVYGEFSANGVEQEYGKEYVHSAGALVMYYTDKGNYNGEVTVKRVDGGSNNDGQAYQRKEYKYNSATSLFYLFTGEQRPSADSTYCVFGMAKDYEDQLENGLLNAIAEYKESLDEDASFTEEQTVRLNRYDPNEAVNKGDLTAEFNTPMEMPIVIKSVTVTKY